MDVNIPKDKQNLERTSSILGGTESKTLHRDEEGDESRKKK